MRKNCLRQAVLLCAAVELCGCRNPSTVTLGTASVKGSPDALFYIVIAAFLAAACGAAIVTALFLMGLPGEARRGSISWWTVRWRRKSQAISVLAFAGFSATIWLGAAGLIGNAILSLGASSGVLAGLGISTIAKRRAVETLAPRGAPQPLECLMHLLGDPEPSYQLQAKEALAHVLPSVEISELRKLSLKHRRALYRELNGSDVLLARSVLYVADALDDVNALPYVNRLIRTNEHSAREDNLQQAALKCRDKMERRRAASADSHNLLRASGTKAGEHTALVRPADAAPTATSTLLHPIVGPEDSPLTPESLSG